ncbi:MAG: hypothetical protein ACJ8AO_20950 [Gemmatimonadaceae bacterium]
MTAVTTTTLTYLLYLAISIALTLWVGRTLYSNGFLFLVDVFRGNEALAHSVNHLLVVGFYLVNFGFVALHLKLYQDVIDARQTIEALADKVGVVLIVLGIMHFGNLYVFSRIRRRATLGDAFPPVPPDTCTTVGA